METSSSSASEQQPGLVSTDAGDVSGGNWWRRGAERDEDVTGQTGSDDEGGDDPDHSADGAERAGIRTHTHQVSIQILTEFSKKRKNQSV